jgi:phosphopantetheine adenylyltransferase
MREEGIGTIMVKFAVYCGRFNPMHFGHGAVVNEMISKFGVENCMLVVGSCNAGFSLRHFFSYQERRGFIKKAFPEMKVVGLPDYPTDEEWLVALDDLISTTGVNPAEVVFFGGCEEDILFFFEVGRNCQIINRFDGTTPKISATEVRDCLIYGRSLDGMVDPVVADEVQSLFRQKWERFKKI